MRKLIIISLLFNFSILAQNTELEEILNIPWGSSKEEVKDRLRSVDISYIVHAEKNSIEGFYGGKYGGMPVKSWHFWFTSKNKLFAIYMSFEDRNYKNLRSFYSDKYGKPEIINNTIDNTEMAIWSIGLENTIGITKYKKIPLLEIYYINNSVIKFSK